MWKKSGRAVVWNQKHALSPLSLFAASASPTASSWTDFCRGSWRNKSADFSLPMCPTNSLLTALSVLDFSISSPVFVCFIFLSISLMHTDTPEPTLLCQYAFDLFLLLLHHRPQQVREAAFWCTSAVYITIVIQTRVTCRSIPTSRDVLVDREFCLTRVLTCLKVPYLLLSRSSDASNSRLSNHRVTSTPRRRTSSNRQKLHSQSSQICFWYDMKPISIQIDAVVPGKLDLQVSSRWYRVLSTLLTS